MRFTSLVLLGLAACSGNEPADEAAPVPAATPVARQIGSNTAMTGYGTVPHIGAQPVTVTEGEGVAVARVTLSPRVSRPIYVDYMTADGTAKASGDYRYAKGRLTFKPGITEQRIEVDIVADDVAEHEESFVLRLYVADGARLDTESVTITILDDD